MRRMTKYIDRNGKQQRKIAKHIREMEIQCNKTENILIESKNIQVETENIQIEMENNREKSQNI